jgi:hypothetical protein
MRETGPKSGVVGTLLRLWFPDRSGIRVAIVGFAAIAVLLFCLMAACYPWAYSLTFGPTLTGTWVGDMRNEHGEPLAMFLRLSRDPGEGGDDLTGSLRLCGPGEIREFSVSGDTRDWGGTTFWFVTSLTDNVDGEGTQVSRAEGKWDRADGLRLVATLTHYAVHDGASHGTATEHDPPDPEVAATLLRGPEAAFVGKCDELRGRSNDSRH